MTRKLSVLITAFGSSNTRAMATIMQDRFPDFSLIACDSNSSDFLTPHPFVKKLFQVPPAKEEEYISELLKICKRESVRFLIPVFDDEVIRVSEHKSLFAKNGVTTFLSALDTLRTCRDKFAFSNFCAENHLPAIKSALKPKFSYPMFIKPRKGNGSHNCFKIFNVQEAEVFEARIKDPLFQTFEEGRLMDVDFVANPKSEVSLAVIKEEISTKNGIGVKVRICENPSLLVVLSKLISDLNYVGIGAVEMFVNDGVIKIIELNIRPSSGIIFSYKAGGDFLGHFFHHAGILDINLVRNPINFGARMSRELNTYELN